MKYGTSSLIFDPPGLTESGTFKPAETRRMTEARRDTNILATHTLPIWSVISLFSLAVHLLLPETVSQVLAAMLLSLIAGVYIGLAVMDGRMKRIVVEATVACLFMAFAVWSLMTAPWLIPLGYLAHAGWDFLHHTPLFEVAMPKWYIPACVVVDVIVGVGLWLIWSL